MAEATVTGLGYDKSGAIGSLTANQFNGGGPGSDGGAATIDGAPIAGCGDI